MAYMNIARRDMREMIRSRLLLNRSTTLLNMAARKNNYAMTKLLLANGANVNIVDDVGMCPAMCAASSCRMNLMELYLKNGLNINQTDDNGWTALHFAASYGAKRVVQLLIDHGANLNAINSQGEKASYIADFYGHEEVAQFLLKIN